MKASSLSSEVHRGYSFSLFYLPDAAAFLLEDLLRTAFSVVTSKVLFFVGTFTEALRDASI